MTPASRLRLSIVEHPVLADTLAQIRDRDTDSEKFRDLVHRAGVLLMVSATSELPTSETMVHTLLATARTRSLQAQPVLLPILRAGLGLLPAAHDVLPHADVSFLGLRRDERSAIASLYLDSVAPHLHGQPVFILEPMIATGGTLVQALALLTERSPGPITVVSLIAAPQGIAALQGTGIGVHVVTAAVDDGLDAANRITPGLGDAGDRLFGDATPD